MTRSPKNFVLVLALTLAACGGDEEESGAEPASAVDRREAEYARFINELAATSLAALIAGSSDAAPELRCPPHARSGARTSDFAGGENERERIRGLGPSPRIEAVLTAVFAGPPGDTRGFVSRAMVWPTGLVGWITASPASGVQRRAPMDPAVVSARFPALDGYVSRTLEGMRTCSLPRVGLTELALDPSDEHLQRYIVDYSNLMSREVCMSASNFDPSTTHTDSVHLTIYVRGPTGAARISNILHRFVDGFEETEAHCLSSPIVYDRR